MKLLMVLFSVFLAQESLADEQFEKFKAEAMANLEERIQKLNEHKSCVNDAKDKEALKGCRSKMKEWREDEREERMEKRKARMTERQEKHQKKKSTETETD